MTKKSRQKFKHLENKNRLLDWHSKLKFEFPEEGPNKLSKKGFSCLVFRSTWQQAPEPVYKPHLSIIRTITNLTKYLLVQELVPFFSSPRGTKYNMDF